MSRKPIKTVLVIEDNPGDARLLREMLNEQDPRYIELTHVECMRDAETYLARHAADAILLDLGLPDAQGLGAVQRAQAAAPNIPLVVLTGLDDETLAGEALQVGAQDYLIKGQIDARGLLRAVRNAVERKAVERLKDGFVSTVSHELRTPLTSIFGALALLTGKSCGTLPAPYAGLLTIAYTNCQRLVRLVNDILDIEKMESRQVAFNFERVRIGVLIEQAIDASRGFAESCGVRVRVDNACETSEVRADPDRLMQVVTNLLSNAIKFSPAGEEVVIALERKIDVILLSVRDHGPGISVEFRPRVFERFAQADATNSRQKGGTGLGLSIVKQIVGRLGGKVGFGDAPEGGAIFHVELPCWDPEGGVAADSAARPVVAEMQFCEDAPSTAVRSKAEVRAAGLAPEMCDPANEATTGATPSVERDANGQSSLFRIVGDNAVAHVLGEIENSRPTVLIESAGDAPKAADSAAVTGRILALRQDLHDLESVTRAKSSQVRHLAGASSRHHGGQGNADDR